jgi:hypothetical protein
MLRTPFDLICSLGKGNMTHQESLQATRGLAYTLGVVQPSKSRIESFVAQKMLVILMHTTTVIWVFFFFTPPLEGGMHAFQSRVSFESVKDR